MNAEETQETLELTGKVEFTGIIKLTFDSESVVIPDADTLYEGILKKNLKQHITLCHQNVPKLLDKKAIKKHLKENKYELTVKVNLEKHSFLVDGEKEVVVYYLTDESSSTLRTWTDNFLQQFTEQKQNITDLRNTTLDKDRVFHLSYMNKSGNPGDSIAIVW